MSTHFGQLLQFFFQVEGAKLTRQQGCWTPIMAMKHAGDRLCEYALVGADFDATCLEPLHRQRGASSKQPMYSRATEGKPPSVEFQNLQ